MSLNIAIMVATLGNALAISFIFYAHMLRRDLRRVLDEYEETDAHLRHIFPILKDITIIEEMREKYQLEKTP